MDERRRLTVGARLAHLLEDLKVMSMPRLALPLLLSTLLLGQVAAQPSVVFTQARPAATAPTVNNLDRALESVVSISSVQPPGPAGPSSRGWSPSPSALLPWLGAGTGILIGQNEILTSYRLIRGNTTVTVGLRGGQTFSARVVGTDPERDLALLRTEGLPQGALRPATLGNSDRLTAGQRLIAVGLSPNGGFVAEEVRVRDVDPRTNELTLDTSLNATARGGPLVNAAGEVVALSTGRFGARLDLPFGAGVNGVALPINAVRSVLANLRSGSQAPSQTGTRPAVPQRARLGIRFVDLAQFNPQQLRALQLPSSGLLVQDVLPRSAAEKAGLRSGRTVKRIGNDLLRVDGDVIVAVDGRRIRRAEELQRAIQSKAIGTEMILEVVRSGQVQRVQVRLETAAS